MNRRDFLFRCSVGVAALASPFRGAARQVQQVDLGGVDGPLHLNWNENPLGPSPAAQRAAAEAVAMGHRYPDAVREQMIETLAVKHGIGTNSIVLGNGSTEILQIVTQAFSSRTPTLVMAEPTFSILLRYQRPFDYRVERVPLAPDFAHDLDTMKAKTTKRPSLVYLCNPNNPTGTLTSSQKIDRWIEESSEDVLFLVDEAYVDYVEDPEFRSASRWIAEKPNVVVTRTFSKVYGMAGLRLGYAMAHPDTADWIRGYSPADNANGPALAAGIASIEDSEWLQTSLDSNRRAKQITLDCLRELQLEVLPSHTNFVMHRVNGPLDLYIGRMRSEGVRVGRPFPPMLSYNRLTLGTPQEMVQFCDLLYEFRRRGWV